MKYNYETPVIEVHYINEHDVICESPGMGDGGQLENGNETPWG